MKYRVECRRRRDDKIQKNFQEFDSLVKYIERRAMGPEQSLEGHRYELTNTECCESVVRVYATSLSAMRQI